MRSSRSSLIWALIITSVAGFMASLDNLVVTTALPSIRTDLGGGLEDLEWTVSAYTLTFAVLLMFGSALGDRFGRRRMFIAGLAGFTVSSALAALAPNLEMLIAARALQGVGAAIMMPLTLTLLTAATPPNKRGMVFGIWGAVNGLAVATGPLIGGGLTEHISWHWIFWLNVPLGLALLPLARIKLDESKGANSRLDLPGTVLASAGLFGIVYGLVRGNADGWTSPWVLAGLIVGAALVAAFVAWEIRLGATPGGQPMLPMRLFRNRSFSMINAASLLMFLGMFGSIFLLSQFLQTVLGYSPTEAGLRMLPWTGMPMIVAPIAGIVSDKIGGRPVVALGLALQAIGLGWFALVASPDMSYAIQLPSLIISGTGMAMFFAPSANLVMGSVKAAEQGIASGANNALRELGGALGVAILAAVFASNGGYETGQTYVDGLVPALWFGSGAVALGALAAFLIRRPARRTASEAPAPELVTAA